LDYFLARYYSSAQGRFTSPDAPLVGQSRRDPQSWNLYGYARNNPLLYVDPTGEDYVLYEYKYDEEKKEWVRTGNVYQVADIANLPKGYAVYGGNENTLYGTGPNNTRFTAQYVEGDAGGVRVQAQYEISALAEGVGFEMNRREAASLHAIEIIGAVNLAPAALASATLSGGTITTLGVAGGPVTAATHGAIIGWGTGQSAAAVAQTQQVTASLTATRVASMVARGLSKEWVQDQLIKYTASIAAGAAKLQNTQLVPRKELMEKILSLWPK
jgi:hypothetical protein